MFVESRPDLWLVKADPGQIEQVIMNLAVNARDAMPEGGRLSISIENVDLDQFVSAATNRLGPGSYVRLTVRDTGSGIDAETLKRVFEPFFTTKDSDRGTGLGLAMVDGIVEQSGGAIAIESHLGWGTAFSVLLPRSLPEAEPPAETMPHDAEAPGSEAVLLVEDDTGVREFVRAVLEREGYRVLEASRGDEALAMVSQLPGAIDLLLTDVVMPGMKGTVLWEQFSASRPGARVLFMSGYTNEDIRLDIRGRGLPYLQKPFTYTNLVREVAGRSAACLQAARLGSGRLQPVPDVRLKADYRVPCTSRSHRPAADLNRGTRLVNDYRLSMAGNDDRRLTTEVGT